jgi:hypothetical protein
MHPDAEKHEKKSSFVHISLFISIISKKIRKEESDELLNSNGSCIVGRIRDLPRIKRWRRGLLLDEGRR